MPERVANRRSREPEARHARRHQHLVEVARVAQPDLRVVDPRGEAAVKARLERRSGQVEARLGEREADVVGRFDEADDALGAEAAHVQGAPRGESPRVGERVLDEDLRCRSGAGRVRRPPRSRAGDPRPSTSATASPRRWPAPAAPIETLVSSCRVEYAATSGSARIRLLTADSDWSSKRTIRSGRSAARAERPKPSPSPSAIDHRGRQHRRRQRDPDRGQDARGGGESGPRAAPLASPSAGRARTDRASAVAEPLGSAPLTVSRRAARSPAGRRSDAGRGRRPRRPRARG